MFDFDSFENSGSTLTAPEKAAAVLLAMGRGVAGRLLKYFTQAELQAIIQSAQTLRTIPPDELLTLVNEFEDLFTEGAGLMDNAKAIEAILEEARTRWEILDVLVIHRVGALEPTDQIVLVLVASSHRGDAFAACEFLMDYLKTRAPFWKQERVPGGTRWVEARAADDAAAARWER